MVPPAKGCKFEERKRKEKKKEKEEEKMRRKQRERKTSNTWKEKGNERGEKIKTANFGRGETKFASYDVPPNNKK